MHKATMHTEAVTYPKIKLGDKEYELRFSCGSIIRLKKEHGIELDELVKKDENGEPVKVKGAEAIERILTLLHAGVGKQAALSMEQIADLIDLGDLKQYADAINEALKKASSQALTEAPSAEATATIN